MKQFESRAYILTQKMIKFRVRINLIKCSGARSLVVSFYEVNRVVLGPIPFFVRVPWAIPLLLSKQRELTAGLREVKNSQNSLGIIVWLVSLQPLDEFTWWRRRVHLEPLWTLAFRALTPCLRWPLGKQTRSISVSNIGGNPQI